MTACLPGCCRVLEHYKAELQKRRDANGGAAGAFHAAASEQRQQQPSLKRARVGSSSDLSGGSVAVSATLKEGDRNVLKLKFARPKKEAAAAAGDTAAGLSRGGVEPAAAAAWVQQQQQAAAVCEDASGGEYQRSRPRRQVKAPPRFAALGHDDEHALQPLEAYGPGPPGAPGVCCPGRPHGICCCTLGRPAAAAFWLSPLAAAAAARCCCASCLPARLSDSPVQPFDSLIFSMISAGAQPYALLVSPAAEVVMDFHAHLHMNEVSGMLAGTFDPATRTIRCGGAGGRGWGLQLGSGAGLRRGPAHMEQAAQAAYQRACTVAALANTCMCPAANTTLLGGGGVLVAACCGRILCVSWPRRMTASMWSRTQRTSGACGRR